MIYTVGHEEGYDNALQKSATVYKQGRKPNYCGGVVWLTEKSARKAIERNGWEGYAVYALEADWKEDTYDPSKATAFRYLENDAEIICKAREIDDS